jgi:hypothetical protein
VLVPERRQAGNILFPDLEALLAESTRTLTIRLLFLPLAIPLPQLTTLLT